MSRIVEFAKMSDREKALEALKVLDQAYAYYTASDEVSPAAAIAAVEAPIDQIFSYHTAA